MQESSSSRFQHWFLQRRLGEERNHRLIFTVKCRYIHKTIQKAQPKQNRHVFFLISEVKHLSSGSLGLLTSLS